MNIFCAFSSVFFNHFNNFFTAGDTIPSGPATTVSHNLTHTPIRKSLHYSKKEQSINIGPKY